MVHSPPGPGKVLEDAGPRRRGPRCVAASPRSTRLARSVQRPSSRRRPWPRSSSGSDKKQCSPHPPKCKTGRRSSAHDEEGDPASRPWPGRLTRLAGRAVLTRSLHAAAGRPGEGGGARPARRSPPPAPARCRASRTHRGMQRPGVHVPNEPAVTQLAGTWRGARWPAGSPRGSRHQPGSTPQPRNRHPLPTGRPSSGGVSRSYAHDGPGGPAMTPTVRGIILTALTHHRTKAEDVRTSAPTQGLTGVLATRQQAEWLRTERRAVSPHREERARSHRNVTCHIPIQMVHVQAEAAQGHPGHPGARPMPSMIITPASPA